MRKLLSALALALVGFGQPITRATTYLSFALPAWAATSAAEKDSQIREKFLKRFVAARKHVRQGNTEVGAVTTEWMKWCESRNQQLQMDQFGEPDCQAKPAPQPQQGPPPPPVQQPPQSAPPKPQP